MWRSRSAGNSVKPFLVQQGLDEVTYAYRQASRREGDAVKLTSVAKYASGKAPYLGVPVFDMSIGRNVTAVFRRQHLQVAVEAAVRHSARVTYDASDHTLNFNSVPGCCYKLRDLKNATGSSFRPWHFKEANKAWARGRRKSAVMRAMPADEKRSVRLQEEIGKLARKRDKIYASAPLHPLLSLHPRGPACEYSREQAAQWHAEKPTRRRLGQLVRRERKTWAIFYADVAAIIGREVSEGQRHNRVCTRCNGPEHITYLKYLYRYVGLATMPYDQEYKWNPYKPCGYGPEHDQNEFQRHRHAQMEYLAAMGQRAVIQSQIDAHKAEIAELGAAQNG